MKNTKNEKFLAMIFQQGGTLRNICFTDSKEKVENFMKITYNFPFYALYTPVNNILNISEMIQIQDLENLNDSNLNDIDLNIKVVGDFLAEEIISEIEITDNVCYNTSTGKELGFDMSQFSEWKKMNTCKECENGIREIGPECFQPASNCCGGCYEKVECESCDGSGLININL